MVGALPEDVPCLIRHAGELIVKSQIPIGTKLAPHPSDPARAEPGAELA